MLLIENEIRGRRHRLGSGFCKLAIPRDPSEQGFGRRGDILQGTGDAVRVGHELLRLQEVQPLVSRYGRGRIILAVWARTVPINMRPGTLAAALVNATAAIKVGEMLPVWSVETILFHAIQFGNDRRPPLQGLRTKNAEHGLGGIMGCNCRSGQQQRWWQPATKAPAAPIAFPKPPVAQPKAVPPRGPLAPPGSGFCPLCGWAVKESFCVDPRTSRLVKRLGCANRACQRRT